jgi:hypothetical protein
MQSGQDIGPLAIVSTGGRSPARLLLAAAHALSSQWLIFVDAQKIATWLKDRVNQKKV